MPRNFPTRLGTLTNQSDYIAEGLYPSLRFSVTLGYVFQVPKFVNDGSPEEINNLWIKLYQQLTKRVIQYSNIIKERIDITLKVGLWTFNYITLSKLGSKSIPCNIYIYI